MSTTGTDLMSDNLICCGIALIGFERLRRSLDTGYSMLVAGRWSLATGCSILVAGLWYKAEGLSRQPLSRYGVTMARQAGLKLQGIKIRPLTFFNSAFRIPNSLAQTCFMKMVYKGYNSSGVLLWCHLIEAVAPGRAEFNYICLLLFSD
jgi:hypothetical protein